MAREKKWATTIAEVMSKGTETKAEAMIISTYLYSWKVFSLNEIKNTNIVGNSNAIYTMVCHINVKYALKRADSSIVFVKH